MRENDQREMLMNKGIEANLEGWTLLNHFVIFVYIGG